MRCYTLLLVVVLVAVVPTQCYDSDPLDPALNWYMPYDRLQINISATGRGMAYEFVMHDLVSKAIAGSTNDAYGKPVLARQRVGQLPYRWLMLDLIGRADDRTMLAVRQDNLYVMAFTDKAGRWYVFNNVVAALNLIPGATTLRFDNDYEGLVGFGGHQALGNLLLGHESTLRAVAQLASYRHAPVAVMMVTLTEAARFREIQIRIANNWESGLGFLDLKNLVIMWRTISCSLLLAKQNNDVWEGSKEAIRLSQPDVGIYTKQQATDALFVLFWPWQQKCSKKITCLN